ncbi:hypothetical protein GP486_001085 [Trichoglossum hirsutum]|uniref:Kinetochore protein Sos7 coiled-coil domain-containing protein n=1 Tax=Trichoglossum hirsutum TaxID=265104 RepID=A0A9P8LHI0_9PEZI|nr:hypothetical protein GP486_001085 [Trichoglossum hirsutum]
MSPYDAEEVLSKLSELQDSHELSIIKISEPISAANDAPGNRSSDISADAAIDSPTPATLEADLTHYRELFSKLRFSYLEQVTKERFLRAIVGDPPLIVEHQENVELEQQLAETKSALKAQKLKVAQLVVELEEKEYLSITQQLTLLHTLPSQIENLQSSIAALQAAHPPPSSPISASQTLPLPATISLLSSQKAELSLLDHQLNSLQATLPRKTRELERLEAELRPLESKKLGSLAGAREARRRKEEAAGGVADDLEMRGRWWRGVEAGLKELLDVDNRRQEEALSA